MQDTLDHYRSVIEQQPHCNDDWLATHLSKARAGDDEARRQILGCWLRLALDYAESSPTSGDQIEVIEEANAGLEDGLAAFDGHTTAELEACLRRHVQARLARMIEEQAS